MSAERSTPSVPVTCPEETAGYDGMFGVYCELPLGHAGPHNDGHVEWDYVNPEFRNSVEPPRAQAGANV